MSSLQTTQPDFKYSDGRPTPHLSMPAVDQGIVFKRGLGPGNCDKLGAREAVVYEEDGIYHLFYDGAGDRGWLACIATSTDLVNWERHGPILDFGPQGSPDGAAATSPWVYFHDGWWHMYYLGTPNVTSAPDFIPSFPYLTLKARARKLVGPWEKQPDITPFLPTEGSWHSLTASPGFVIQHGDEFLQFMSGTSAIDCAGTVPDVSKLGPNEVKRTVGIARTKDLNAPWQIDPEPIVPLAEQIENSSIYYEPANQTWFLFTNHIGSGVVEGNITEFTDAIWVYWSKDPEHWDPQNKAVVLDGENCTWAKRCIGMPAAVPHDGKLAILYDAAPGESTSHMLRHIGLCWLDLPLQAPARS